MMFLEKLIADKHTYIWYSELHRTNLWNHSPDPEFPFSNLGSSIEAGFSQSGALSQPRHFYKITCHDEAGK